MTTSALLLTEALVACPSVTPDDAGCQTIIQQRLAALGFECRRVDSGPSHFRVSNLWATRKVALPAAHAPEAAPMLVFAGHTDVAPTGPLQEWLSDPFTPTQRDGRLYGRGSCDMKASIAAFIVAVEEFLAATPQPTLSIGFLITSDEEGPATDGTLVVCDWLRQRGENFEYCIVGEPTGLQKVGDTIKNGRRGSMSGKLTVKGIQGHIAYPDQAKNPIHLAMPALAELAAKEWDNGNEFFPATSWQISNMHAGTGASNVIPGTLVVDFNFRFSTESSSAGLQQRVAAILDSHGLDYDVKWSISGQPFLTMPGTLVDAVQASIREETGLVAQLSTSGGTSDGRFITKICPQILELGPTNASIHQVNESVEIAEIEILKNIYRRTLEQLNANTTR